MSDVQTIERTAAAAPTLEPVMRSPVHHQHAVRGARFIRVAGWDLPAAYGTAEAERQLIHEGLVIADITARGKADLRGRVDELPRDLLLPVDAVFARLSPSWALVLTPPGTIDAWLPAAEQAVGRSMMVTDATSVYAGFALLGTQVDDLLSRLTTVEVFGLQPGSAAGMQLAKIPGIVIRRDRATEVYVGSEYGRYAWESLLSVGRPLGLQPVGWEALRAEGWR